MGLFSKHKKPEIPPVEQPSYSSQPSYNSQSFPSNPRTNSNYSSSSVGNRYGQQEEDHSRRQLFGNTPAPSAKFGSQFDSYAQNPSGYDASQEQSQEGDQEEEVDAIKQQIRFTKQESLASSRNALRVAQEAEELARGNLIKLADQSERISNTERSLDLAKAHNLRAEDEAKEIKALNRSIFRPNISFNKSAKRDAEEAKILARHLEEKAEREKTRRDMEETRNRVGGTFQAVDRQGSSSQNRGGRSIQERSRYQFESTESDEELENELDANLDGISDVASRLKQLAMTAGQEVDAQNVKLGRIGEKADDLDINIIKNTNYLKRLK